MTERKKKLYQASDLFHTSWDTLTKKQLLQLLQMQAMVTREKEPDKQAYIKTCMLYAINKKKSFFKKITDAQMVDLFAELAFLQEPTNRWFVPSFQHNGFKYYAPMPGLKGFQLPDGREAEFTFAKLMYSDSFYTIMLASEQQEYFYKFVTHLYLREPFKQGRARNLSGIDMQVIILNYAANRDAVFRRFPHLFPRKENEENQQPETSNQHPEVKPTGEMWQSLLHSLADSTAFAGLETAKNAIALEALGYLDQKAKEVEEMKVKGGR